MIFFWEINLIQIQLLFAIVPFSHERCDTVINAVLYTADFADVNNVVYFLLYMHLLCLKIFISILLQLHEEQKNAFDDKVETNVLLLLIFCKVNISYD